MRDLLYSVIVPIYNAENFLEECIRSVINQTYTRFEIILVNDGSSDSSASICSKYTIQDSRIKYYDCENRGVLTARQFGIEKSIGDYCLFIDADDYWDLNLLETVNNYLINDKYDLVIYRYRKFNSKGTIINSEALFRDGEVLTENNIREFYNVLLKGKLNSLCIKAIKRNAFNAPIDDKYTKIKRSEDFLQSLYIALNVNSVIYIDKVMYNYRINELSATHSFDLDNLDGYELVRSATLNFMKEKNINANEDIEYLYLNSCKTVLKYIYRANNLNITKKESIEIVDKIRQTKFFNDTIGKFDFRQLSPENRMRYTLFVKEQKIMLYAFDKIINLCRAIKYHTMKGVRYEK